MDNLKVDLRTYYRLKVQAGRRAGTPFHSLISFVMKMAQQQKDIGSETILLAMLTGPLSESSQRATGDRIGAICQTSVIREINGFQPFSWYKFERQYQIDLARHLKKSFSQVQLEQQIGSSRPDIVVEKIAIEIKGPTISRALQTISDKILRYYNNFDAVVIVLFDVQVTGQYYDEWLSGIERHYPRVKVIRKDR